MVKVSLLSILCPLVLSFDRTDITSGGGLGSSSVLFVSLCLSLSVSATVSEWLVVIVSVLCTLFLFWTDP